MREFFQQNETVIVFAHGVVFFALGFAVWLQRRRATRLTLTASLIWLASFAFLESLAIWGYVFVPIQADYLDPGVVEALLVVRAVIQTVAFVFLLQFGLRLLPVSRRTMSMLSALSVVVLAAILLGSAWAAGRQGWTVAEWERSAEAAARYLLLFPGALLSAVAPWVPGGPATAAGWLEATSLPLALLRGLLGLGMLVAVIKLLEIFEVEAKQRIEALDRARAVAEERARFGRDLHDGTIQSIYACGLHLESLAMRIDEPEMREEVRTVVSSLNSTIDGLRGYINALRRPPDSPAGIAAALDALTRDFAAETGMQVRFSARGMESSGPLPEEAGQHLAQIMREALANVARHAGPCAVDAALEFRPDELGLTVTDCGRGLVADRGPAEPGHGNGMRNMHERARWLGGRLEVSPAPDGGTRVSVAIPLDFEAPDQVDVPPASEVSSR